MAVLSDIDKRGALRALAALSGQESMTTGEFEIAAGVTSGPVATLRERLEELGLIVVAETPVRGATMKTVRLTAVGRKVAAHAAAIRDLLEPLPSPKREDATKGLPRARRKE